jgi:uncharacterized membrane protein YsdA (DUF1294 family)
MLYLSIAFVLIFVLYLIDKRNAWKGAAKIAAVLIGLLMLGSAGIYGWAKYEDRRANKKREADVTACIKTITEGSIVFVPTGDEIGNVVKSFCESRPGANLACGIKSDSYGNPTTYSIGDTDKGSPGKVCTAKGWGQDPMLASTCKNWESQHPLGSPLDHVSAEETNGKPVEGIIATPEGCSGPLEDAYNAKLTKYNKETRSKTAMQR